MATTIPPLDGEHLTAPLSTPEVDIAIIGAGPVGSTLALLLQALLPETCRLALIDAQAPSQRQQDPRTLALAEGSRLILQQINAWPHDKVMPIRQIHISRAGRPGRTHLSANEMGVPALGYVVGYGALLEGLLRVLPPPQTWAEINATASPLSGGLYHLRPYQCRVVNEGGADQPLTLHLQIPGSEAPGHTLRTQCLIQAEGGVFSPNTPASSASRLPRISTAALSACLSKLTRGAEIADAPRQRASNQHAVLAEVVAPDLGRDDSRRWQAYERFTAEGPLALLPKRADTGDTMAHYSLVWCCLPARATQLKNMDTAAFNQALTTAFGSRLGRLTLSSTRHTYPLGVSYYPQIQQGRQIRIGNAAQTLHPVAGQGLNLGLRDALELAQALRQGWSSEPVALCAALQQLAQQRRVDRQLTLGLTTLMSELFTLPGLAQLGSHGLLLLDQWSVLRRPFAAHMMYGQRQ
ncbi:FAD-dependent monooxygenase [Parvibium lacunae]|uniref:2-octaprenyl-6-methoxyphenyl hydroxylase n=1 Tax=Parvibium lacunae TaxID=1888893 RepID=A0A368L4I8_9BURK|nr:FAD-dependent monooxygenase [Parvibium lacunae]RCS58393.1 2-octaprenyl-6-methoxyphenyl hydroxylase [Parvibium lacunae]